MEGSRPRSFLTAIRGTRKRAISHQKWKRSSRCLMKKNKISEKLEALKNLIPSSKEYNDNGKLKSEDLFKETANYIALLQTQVIVLQKLIGFHEASCSQDQVQEKKHVV